MSISLLQPKFPQTLSLLELERYCIEKAFYNYPDLSIEDLSTVVLGISVHTLYRKLEEHKMEYREIQDSSPYRKAYISAHLRRLAEKKKKATVNS